MPVNIQIIHLLFFIILFYLLLGVGVLFISLTDTFITLEYSIIIISPTRVVNVVYT